MGLNLWKKPDDEGWMWMRGCLRIFEWQVLIFPLLVVFLACSSFLFWGRCAAWQWWVAVVMVVGAPFLTRNGWKTATGALGLFTGLLLAIKCLLPPVLWDNATCVDMTVYHLPMAQLLIEGWNPVTDPLAEGIVSQLGLDMWGMAPTLVAFFSKTMAVFAAVAYKFVGNPTGLTIPGLTFLWLGLALQVTRQFHGLVRLSVLGALVWVLPIVFIQMFVDLSLAFASAGLLLTMANDLERRQFSWLHLGVWTIWMATIKLNALPAVAAFWLFFAGSIMWRERKNSLQWMVRLILLGTLVGLSALVVAWSPYGVSWQRYGHPLYPFLTADEERFPAQDPGWDIRVVNDDFRTMDQWGLWVYEYISPSLAKGYYRHKLGRPDFEPRRSLMESAHYLDSNWHWRLSLWILFAVLLIHPKGRIWGVAGLLLTGCVTWDKIGHHRYQPWFSALGCLAIALLAESATKRFSPKVERMLSCLFIVGLGLVGVSWLWHHARDVEFQAIERSLVREKIHCRFWSNTREPSLGVTPDDFVPRYNYLTAMENQCRLLLKEMGRGEKTQILGAEGWTPLFADPALTRRPLWKWDERQWFSEEKDKDMRCIENLGMPWHGGNAWDGYGDPNVAEPWAETPWHLYWVPWGDHTEHVWEYYRGAEPREGETWSSRMMRRLKFVAKAWFMTYPQEAWKRICFGKTERERCIL